MPNLKLPLEMCGSNETNLMTSVKQSKAYYFLLH